MQTAVVRLLMDDLGQGFDPGTQVYVVLKAALEERLLQFAKRYSAALSGSADLLDENQQLTQQGRLQCDLILDELNTQNPLPRPLITFLKAHQRFEDQLSGLNKQLNNGTPFESGSREHGALITLGTSLRAAQTKLKSSVNGDGEPIEYKLNDFTLECKEAIEVAENSPLKHHRGWWAKYIKPIIIGIGILCAALTGLIFLAPESVKNYARDGFWNISKDTKGMRIVSEFKNSADELAKGPENQSKLV